MVRILRIALVICVSLCGNATVICSSNLVQSECQRDRAHWESLLKQSHLDKIQVEWRIAPLKDWSTIARIARQDPESLAIASVDNHIVYVREDVVFGIAPTLAPQYWGATRPVIEKQMRLLRHEVAHIVCQTTSEEKADRAADRMEVGTKPEKACR